MSISRPASRARTLFALLLLSAAHLAAAAEFVHGPYRITVTADTSGVMPTPHYEVTVADADLLLTRLLAPYAGTLSKSFVADLDRDGRFEVIVTFSHASGQQTEMRLFSWQDDNRLAPVAVGELDDAQRAGYRGGDEYALVDGEVIRVFQIYAREGESWQPTAAQRRLRYAFREARWKTLP